MAAPTLDPVLRSAVDLAREAAVEVAGGPELVGEHLGTVVEGERLVAHQFAATAPGYPGWQWTVTLARVPRGRVPTVNEVALLPGDGALLAPPWVPWAERLRPGDLGAGDVLPYLPDDDRLDQGYEATGDVDVDTVAIEELGLGRARVLSRRGRDDAARRWYAGVHGPTSPVAVAAEKPCSTCGFLVLLAGSMRTMFGVCANEWSPDDGCVVSMDHGCGAHSETDAPTPRSEWPAPAADVDLEIVPPEGPTADPGPASDAVLQPSVAVPGPTAEAEPAADADPAPTAEAEPAAAPTAEPEPTDEPIDERPGESAVVAVERRVDDATDEPVGRGEGPVSGLG